MRLQTRSLRTLPDPDGAGSATAPETTYRYDAAGQLLSVTDPLGRVTSYTYDNMGRQKTVTLPDPDGIAPAGPLAAPVTTYVYNANGQLASVIDAQSQTVSYTYNAAGLMATMTDPRGTTTYLYDALGRQVSITEPDPDGGGPLAAPSTSYTYDNEGDMVSMTTLDGATSYEYDDLGRLTKVTMPDPDGGGSEVSAWTTYTYDAVGRTLTETDRLGHGTSYDYDNLGRLIKKTNAEGGKTEYTYDANGNRLTLTDPEENATTWTFDALNRMLTNTNELSDTRTYEYDAAGNVVEYTDRNGRVTVYEYDDLQRRTAEKWMDGATVVRTLSYTYDAASQLTSASDPEATYNFYYDNLGRNTSITHDLADLGFDVIVSEEYDALGRRTSLAAEFDGTDDLINTYVYDYLNRMTQVTQGSQSGGNVIAEKRVDFAYDAEDKGQFTSITRYADLAGTELVATSTYGYDDADRITSLDHDDSSSSTLAGYTWAYDEGNRLTAFTVYGYSAEDATYSYDDTDQLTGADRSGTSDDEAYTYDENGNRTNSGYSTGDNNQLLSDGTYNYTYDDEGNRLTKTNISTGDYIEYTWDYRNRLTNITTKNSLDVVTHEVDYSYDIFNRRIVKTIDTDGAGSGTATEEVYIYDGLREERGAAGDHILLRFDEADDLADRFMYGPSVDQILASEEVSNTSTAGDVLWALTDHQETIRDVAEYDSSTDTTSVVNHFAYDAFGNIASETNSGVDFVFAYAGRERDTESDLQYNRARYYDAVLGRWTAEDPLGFEAGDENLARYVGNNLTVATDPSGLWAQYGKNQWQATDPSNTFLELLELIDPQGKLRKENVMAIVPVKTGDPDWDKEVKDGYDKHDPNSVHAKAVPCGIYDIFNLVGNAKNELSFGVGQDIVTASFANTYIENAGLFYGIPGNLRHLSSNQVGVVMDRSSNTGASPISSLLVVGHGSGYKQEVGAMNGSNTFGIPDTRNIFRWSKYEDAVNNRLSMGFWLSVDVQVRLSGCNTAFFASKFAAKVLRGTDANAFGTKMYTWAETSARTGNQSKMGWSSQGKKPITSGNLEWTTSLDTFHGMSPWAKHSGKGR